MLTTTLLLPLATASGLEICKTWGSTPSFMARVERKRSTNTELNEAAVNGPAEKKREKKSEKREKRGEMKEEREETASRERTENKEREQEQE